MSDKVQGPAAVKAAGPSLSAQGSGANSWDEYTPKTTTGQRTVDSG